MTTRNWITIGMIVLCGLMATPAMAMGSGPDRDAPEPLADAPLGGTVEGEVVDIADDTVFVKTPQGKTIRLVMTSATTRERTFEVGDRIEAVMSPEGVATSIHLRQKAFKR